MDFLFTKLAAVALVQLTTEALVHEIMQSVAQRNQMNLIDNFTHESLLQEQSCLFLTDATLPHVEQSSVVELSDGTTMRTLHVIGIDF